MTVHIRPETPADLAAVHDVNARAFDRLGEADLVDRLRGTPPFVISLLAETEGQVVGHILFTAVTVTEPEGPTPAVALGPMAVLPEFQRLGIGSALVRAGLEACRQAGHDLVFVLGHPDYYPRFGFQPAQPKGLTCKWPVPDEVFMVAELAPGGLGNRRGQVQYAPAFDEV